MQAEDYQELLAYRNISSVDNCRQGVYLLSKVEQMAKAFHEMGSIAFGRPENEREVVLQMMARQLAEKQAKLLAEYQRIGTVEEFRALKQMGE